LKPSLLDQLRVPGAIRVEFQPIMTVSLKSDRTCPAQLYAYEALARGPKGTSMERPDVLFEYARRKSVEAEIDLICIGEVLSAAEELPGQPSISINLHGSTMTNVEHFAETFLALAGSHGIAPNRLMLEIVEHRAPWSMDILRTTLDELRAAGIRIALDDLGVAASNYRMIVDCRPDHLKIDRYIVHGCSADPYRLAVLRSIVTLAQSCAAIPIAEGVEEQRDLEVILDLGIDKVQGWLYGPSMPASAINLERTAS
jgi:EAL domain-containing protein (putative c-di-GMP-specific phosphodiesterase class I)